jgi:purine-cytosine permease-like protein
MTAWLAVDPHWVTMLVLLIVIALDESTINVMNLHTGGLSLSNMFEGPGRFGGSPVRASVVEKVRAAWVR